MEYPIVKSYEHDFDELEEKINDLASSIKETGIVQPVIVTQKGKKYMLIAGERRWRAAKVAGLESVPCIERDINEVDALMISLVENIQREDLSPVEEAGAYRNLIKEFSWTQQEISQKVGKSRSTVANTLRILTLPEDLIELVSSGAISAGHARALLAVKDFKKRKLLAKKIIREKLTVRESEKLALAATGKTVRKKKTPYGKILPEIKKIEDKFEKCLGTKVKINIKSGIKKSVGGSIEIEFYSLRDFDRISDIILIQRRK